MRKIKAIVAAADGPVAEKLCRSLAADHCVELSGRCSGLNEAIRLAAGVLPDVVLLDLRLTGSQPRDTIGMIKGCCGAAVMAMGDAAGGALVSLEAGASDFVLMPVGGSESDLSLFTTDAVVRMLISSLKSQHQNRLAVSGGAIRLIAAAAAQGGLMQAACLLKGLPADCPPVLLLQRRPDMSGDFPTLLASLSSRSVMIAADGDELVRGSVSVVSEGMGVVEHDGKLAVSRRIFENEAVSGADVLFRSAAGVLGKELACISFSGEGIGGLEFAAACGGIAILYQKNTLLRAADYTPPGGIIELSLEDMASEILSHSKRSME